MRVLVDTRHFAAVPADIAASAVTAEMPRADEPGIRLGNLLAGEQRRGQTLCARLYFTRPGDGTVYHGTPDTTVHADAVLCVSHDDPGKVLVLAKKCTVRGAKAVVSAGIDEVFGFFARHIDADEFRLSRIARIEALARRLLGRPYWPSGTTERLDEIAWCMHDDGYASEWASQDSIVSCSVCERATGVGGMHVVPIESRGDTHYLCDTCLPRVRVRLRLLDSHWPNLPSGMAYEPPKLDGQRPDGTAWNGDVAARAAATNDILAPTAGAANGR